MFAYLLLECLFLELNKSGDAYLLYNRGLRKFILEMVQMVLFTVTFPVFEVSQGTCCVQICTISICILFVARPGQYGYDF